MSAACAVVCTKRQRLLLAWRLCQASGTALKGVVLLGRNLLERLQLLPSVLLGRSCGEATLWGTWLRVCSKKIRYLRLLREPIDILRDMFIKLIYIERGREGMREGE